MGDVTLKSVGSMQKGNYIVIEGAACVVTGTQTSRPGKHGHAKVRLQAVGLIDGKKRDVVMPGHDEVEVPVVGKRNAQVLSIAGDHANVMDMETYETFDLLIAEELKEKVSAGDNVLYWEILNDKVMKQIMQKAQ
jgi:translation initiation factor 5A